MDSALYKKTFEVACGASVKRYVMRKPSTSEIIATPANQIVAKIPGRYKNVVQFADTPLPPPPPLQPFLSRGESGLRLLLDKMAPMR